MIIQLSIIGCGNNNNNKKKMKKTKNQYLESSRIQHFFLKKKPPWAKRNTHINRPCTRPRDRKSHERLVLKRQRQIAQSQMAFFDIKIK